MTTKRTKKPVLMNRGHSDDLQSPPEALRTLLPYLNKRWTIWEPAAGKGNLVSALERFGCKVIASDISKGLDFLTVDVPRCHAIVTNPPFSLKDEFLERCFVIGKPFALLLPLTTVDSKKRRELIRRYGGMEVIVPNGRINFETPNGGSSSWFATAWWTWKLITVSDYDVLMRFEVP